jgi:hypothetical protein
MMLGQNGVKKDAKQRAAKNAREHDQADCDGTHDYPPAPKRTRRLRGYCCFSLRISSRLTPSTGIFF